MSEVRLIIREANQDWSGNVHGSSADRAIAALSADPITLAELEAAYERFMKRVEDRPFLGNLRRGLDDEPYDAGMVIIDLAARLVVAESTYSYASPKGEVEYHNGRCCTTKRLSYHLADDWLFSDEIHIWRQLADKRRQERAENSPLNSREVLYGKPLLECVAKGVFNAYANIKASTPNRANDNEANESVADLISTIHADWLLNAREDLRGDCPRSVLIERHDHLMWDIQDRSMQWSTLDHCPPGLSNESFAFRFGGFGTHEIVMYYELVRELLWSSWERRSELGDAPITLGDFMADEVDRLASVREEWLNAPHPEFHGRTPQSIIDRERVRLPEGVSGREAIVDPDCPCCQGLAELPGPVFWHLDGSGMDDDFAFDYRHRTREAWESERREWKESSRKFTLEYEVQKRLGVKNPAIRSSEDGDFWSTTVPLTMADSSTQSLPIGKRLFDIGSDLAKLIVDLEERSVDPLASGKPGQLAKQLERDFVVLREYVQLQADHLDATSIAARAERLAETLSWLDMAEIRLTNRANALAVNLDKLFDPPSNDFLEEDIPF